MFRELLAFSLLMVSGNASAAKGDNDNCQPTPPATCYPDDCKSCYCLGPSNYQVNAPVSPKTCDGDFTLTLAGFYWNAHQEGLEYGIKSEVPTPGLNSPTADILELNNLLDARYLSPNFRWEFGFKLGVAYSTNCDGWDVNVLWTWYKGTAHKKVDTEGTLADGSLIPLWSAFAPAQGRVLYAEKIRHHWKLRLNLIDIELGRNFWNSKYLALRPHVGIRIANIKQDYDLYHNGGSWDATNTQVAYNNFVELENYFRGAGLRAGLNSEWNLGCGWAIYGNWAMSIVYGKFSLEHEEDNVQAATPYGKVAILSTSQSLRACKAMFDLALGIQWSTLFCDCQYGFTGMIGWENHLFFHQNQLWRVMRAGDTAVTANFPPNNTGENNFQQTRGNLNTQGWTLTLKFDF